MIYFIYFVSSYMFVFLSISFCICEFFLVLKILPFKNIFRNRNVTNENVMNG